MDYSVNILGGIIQIPLKGYDLTTILLGDLTGKSKSDQVIPLVFRKPDEVI